MKKRYIVLGILAIELVSIPAAAQMLDRVSFQMPQRVVHAEFPRQPGIARMFITSNAPFAIVSEGHVSDYNIRVSATGEIGEQPYGANAQLPGPVKGCATTVNGDNQIIYTADRKTAKSRGEVTSQAILVEIRYPSELEPKFDVVTQEKSEKYPSAQPCQAKLT